MKRSVSVILANWLPVIVACGIAGYFLQSVHAAATENAFLKGRLAQCGCHEARP